jgi:hypothetical protein
VRETHVRIVEVLHAAVVVICPLMSSGNIPRTYGGDAQNWTWTMSNSTVFMTSPRYASGNGHYTVISISVLALKRARGTDLWS